jgi:hypothetical protein
MTNSQRLASVRRCIDRWLEQQEIEGDVEIRDAVLIRDGFYVGRRFQMGTFQAVWFMEEDELKIQDMNGNLLAKLDSNGISDASQKPEHSRPEVDEEAMTIPMTRPQVATDQVATDQEVRRAA